jgi:phosphatidate cytidylyltransferase
MKNRIITGILFGALWLLTLCAGSLNLFWLLVVIICALGLFEFFTISLNGRERIYRPAAIVIGLFPLMAAQTGHPEFVHTAFMLSLFFTAVLAIISYRIDDNCFLLMAKICAGISFVGLTAAHLVLLMAETNGMHWLILLTLIITASDSGAYFTGSAIGHHKLCPRISPGKTIEGFVGGLAAAVIVTLLSGPLLFTDISQYHLAFLAVILSCLGVAGDLTESIFKRSNNVKDSGTILPGHGGILDRVDSILTAGPALYYIVTLGLA